MIKNKLKQLWAEGKPTINGWLSIGNPFTAEIMAAQGYDSVSIDVQHGALDYSNVLPMFQAMRASGVVPMARVPWLEPGIIMKVLDAGAYGVICPMVNTPEQAAEFVSYVRYPPLGQRSFGPTRASLLRRRQLRGRGERRDPRLRDGRDRRGDGEPRGHRRDARPRRDLRRPGRPQLQLVRGTPDPRLRPRGAGADRRPEADRRGLQGGGHPRGAALRDARLCGPGDRLGLRHDHGRRRQPPPRSGRRSQRRPLPRTHRGGARAAPAVPAAKGAY